MAHMTTTQRLNAGRVLDFHAPTSPAARIFHQLRAMPGIDRAELSRTLGLSQPTVARQVSALIDADVIAQGPAPASSKKHNGRTPTVLRPAATHIVSVGAHVGARSTVLLASDGAGRTIRRTTIPLDVPGMPADHALDALAAELRSFARPLPRPIGLGVCFSAHVNADGEVTSPTYGWQREPALEKLARKFPRVPVSVATGVSAMAGHELATSALTPPTHADLPGDFESTLYFYARDVISHAWIMGGRVHRRHIGAESATFRTIAGSGALPAYPDASPLSNTALLRCAEERGLGSLRSLEELVELAGRSEEARELLRERAQLLARIIGLALDIVDPSALVLAGEAFSSDPLSTKDIARSLRQRGGLDAAVGADERTVRIQPAGPGIIRDAARTVSLHRFWQDPLSA